MKALQAELNSILDDVGFVKNMGQVLSICGESSLCHHCTGTVPSMHHDCATTARMRRWHCMDLGKVIALPAQFMAAVT